MGDLLQFPDKHPKADSLRELETANQKLVQKLGAMGIGLDGTSIMAMRMDVLLNLLMKQDERIEFELQFQLQLSDALQQAVRDATFSTGGLVVPK
jgi:hypothetical protein